jgi:hypothetical protein
MSATCSLKLQLSSHFMVLMLMNIHSRIGHEGPEGKQRYSSTLSLTSALDAGGWPTPRPGRFTSGKKTRYAFYKRLGGPQGRFGRERKTSPTPGFDPRKAQPVESRYSDHAIPAHDVNVDKHLNYCSSSSSLGPVSL